MVTSTTSAPGKLILFGEHAVVYGKAAIAACLSSLRVMITVDTRADDAIEVVLPDLDGTSGPPGNVTHKTWPISSLLAAIGDVWAGAPDIRTPVIPSAELGSVLEIACGVSDMTGKAIVPPVFLALAMLGPLLSSPSSPVRGVTITINMATLPVAAGLGSSAALSVAVSAALLDVYFACAGLPAVYDSVRGVVDVGAAAFDGGYHPLEAQRALINDWAFAGETLFHGSPSGLDNTVATYGGALLYVNSPKRLESLGDGLPPLNILITNTRVPKNTKALVAGVRALREALPGVVDPILASIDAISASFAQSASGGPVCDVGKLISMNQHLLCALGVGHPALDALVDIGVKHGLPSKLTGAGGGGCGYSYIPPGVPVDGAVRDLQALGYDCFQSVVGGPGVLFYPKQ